MMSYTIRGLSSQLPALRVQGGARAPPEASSPRHRQAQEGKPISALRETERRFDIPFLSI